MTLPWYRLIVVAGVGQLILVAASPAIPRALGWPEDLAKLRPLTRQVFWTSAGYIWATNLSFGLASSFAPRLLLDRSPLFRAPQRSTSLGEFWRRRWYPAFSEMMALAIYQPLA